MPDRRYQHEIGVEAAVGGRRLTLDPIGEKIPLTAVNTWEVESTIPAGFRQVFISGENEEAEIELSSGAGLGSKWLTFNYEPKNGGRQVQLVVDATELTQALADIADTKSKELDTLAGAT